MDYMQVVEEGDINILKEIHDIIVNQLPCRYISKPVTGKVVVSHTDVQEQTKLHLGETFETYCEVEVDGNSGYGCVPGIDPERALYAAVIDSIIWHRHPLENVINPMIDAARKDMIYNWSMQRKELCV